MKGAPFDLDCRLCPRLANFLDEVRARHPAYHCRPVAPFGSVRHRLLVVGLAPGMHGANRTGQPFTGDHAGIEFDRPLAIGQLNLWLAGHSAPADQPDWGLVSRS